MFEATAAPYAILDNDLKIRAVNSAYEAVTGRLRSDLLGEDMLEAFPDNLSDPHADGVAHLSASLEYVLRRGVRHYMGVQRYDVPDTQAPGEFRCKVWTPVTGVGPGAAFELLREQSARQHRKLREIAMEMVATRTPS